MSGYGNNLWKNNDGYGVTAGGLAYLTPEQNARRERIRVARMLWQGHHRKAFLNEGRTQFNFPEVKVQDVIKRPYLTFNVLRLITTTLTDLLLGEAPIFRTDDQVDDGRIQEELDNLATRSDLHRVFMDAARTASWAGEALVEIIRWDGQVYVQDVKVDQVFPVGNRQPDGQYPAYVRFAEAYVIKTSTGPQDLLLKTTYLPGKITRECYVLNSEKKTGSPADLALWPMKRNDGSALLPEENTGITWNTMIWVGNELDEGCPTSDYDGLLHLQDELNAKQTQIARVIAKHADPKLAVPETAADANGNIQTSHDVYFYRDKNDIPGYITWEAQLDAAIKDRDFTLQALAIQSEISLGLLGLEQGAAPDSAKKLRLQATKALARVNRKATFMKPFIRTALDTALMMISASGRVQMALPTEIVNGQTQIAGGMVTAELRDGLPVDELDQATVISTLTGGKPTMSVESAVELRLGGDQEAVAKELERLAQDNANATPSVFFPSPANTDRAVDTTDTNLTQSRQDAETTATTGN